MRNPKDFFRPLAVGAPEPLREIPVRPSRMIHFFDPPTRRWWPRCPTWSARSTSCSATSRTRSRPTRQGGRPRRAGRRSAARPTSATPSSGPASTRLDSPWVLDDLTTLVTEIGDKLDVIMIPKVEGPEDIHYVDRLLAQLEAKAAPRPAAAGARDPRDRPRRGQRRGDLRRQPADAGPVPRPGRPRRRPPDEDDPRRRRPPRLPGARRTPIPDDPDAPRATYQQDLWHYTIARMVDACAPTASSPTTARSATSATRRLRGPVPQRLPARLRRRVEPAPDADRHRQEGVLARSGRRGARQAGHRGDGRRHRRGDARREDGGRRLVKQCQVMVELAEQLADRDPELAEAYGF